MSQKLFQQACVALFGLQYQAPAARALGIARSTVVRYAKGDRNVPPEIFDRLHDRLIRHGGDVDRLIGKLAAARLIMENARRARG